MKIKSKQFWMTFLNEIAGSALIAAGVYNFAVASGFPLTGFTGIATILYHFFGTPIGTVTLLLNIPVAIICYKILGRRFIFRTLRCMIVSTIMVDLIMPLFPAYEGNRMLSALCSGAFQGIGYGLIYRAGSSTGGLDFITLSIKSKKPHLSLGALNFVLDFLVVLVGGLLFNDVDSIIYGIIINTILAYTIDKMMFGANAGKLVMIITENGEMITKLIDKVIDRGSTLIRAEGGYKFDDKQVILCACSSKQAYALQEVLHQEDPSSFTIIMDSTEVHGQGFIVTKVGHDD